ncbi:MAG: efflux RND transporter periplasmic adaptor subunit [Sideroxydans sp.]|nr:efflux RND transporter periplasmic adaptor subunit [Sideroxydans sp.]
MDILKRACGHARRTIATLLAVSCLFGAATTQAQAASTDTHAVVTANVQTFDQQFHAYGQVEPIAIVQVRAASPGIVSGMNLLPGQVLKSGQEIGKLGGPEIKALLLQSNAELRSAQASLAAAGKSLVFQKQQRELHLATQLAVIQAESVLAQAQSANETARANLRALQQMIILRSPVDGQVSSVDAANGERMAVGQPVFTLQPANKLWLKAVYYGAEAAMIKPGMEGRFISADDSNPIPVRIATVSGSIAKDGGESVGLMPVGAAPVWMNGESGTVVLNGSKSSMVAVPTRALILDQGKWWVLVHTSTGNHPQEVVPGPAHGWETFIMHGLAPGTEVVVDNAYLEFHRSISQRYQPPD